MKHKTVPHLVYEYAYSAMASRDCVASTISIGIGSKSELSITGGSPDISPVHSYDKRYISLQEFINGVVKNSISN